MIGRNLFTQQENGGSIKLRTKELIKTYRRPFQPSLYPTLDGCSYQSENFLCLSLSPFFSLHHFSFQFGKSGTGNDVHLPDDISKFFLFFVRDRWKKKRIGKERNEEKVAKFDSPLHRDYFCARI